MKESVRAGICEERARAPLLKMIFGLCVMAIESKQIQKLNADEDFTACVVGKYCAACDPETPILETKADDSGAVNTC